MSKVNPNYVIYQAIEKLQQAKNTRSPYKVKMLVDEALEILKDYLQF